MLIDGAHVCAERSVVKMALPRPELRQHPPGATGASTSTWMKALRPTWADLEEVLSRILRARKQFGHLGPLQRNKALNRDNTSVRA